MKTIILLAFVAGMFVACCGCVGDGNNADKATPTAPAAPDGMALFRSEDGGFYLFVPEDWTQSVSDEKTKFNDGDVIAETSTSITEEGWNEPTASVRVQVVKLATGVDLKKIAASKAEWFERRWSANDGMQTKSIEFGEMKGVEYSMQHLTRAGGADFARLILGVKNEYGYIVHTRRAAGNSEYDEVIDKIVKSFKIYAAPKRLANKDK